MGKPKLHTVILGITLFALITTCALLYRTIQKKPWTEYLNKVPKGSVSIPTVTTDRLVPIQAFNDTNQNLAPLKYQWNEADKFLISGVVQQSKIEEDSSVVIQIPDTNGKILTLIAYFSTELGRNIMSLKLDNGQYTIPQIWLTRNLDEITPSLQPGSQVILSINVDKRTADEVIEKARTNSYATIGPITHITYGNIEGAPPQ